MCRLRTIRYRRPNGSVVQRDYPVQLCDRSINGVPCDQVDRVCDEGHLEDRQPQRSTQTRSPSTHIVTASPRRNSFASEVITVERSPRESSSSSRGSKWYRSSSKLASYLLKKVVSGSAVEIQDEPRNTTHRRNRSSEIPVELHQVELRIPYDNDDFNLGSLGSPGASPDAPGSPRIRPGAPLAPPPPPAVHGYEVPRRSRHDFSHGRSSSHAEPSSTTSHIRPSTRRRMETVEPGRSGADAANRSASQVGRERNARGKQRQPILHQEPARPASPPATPGRPLSYHDFGARASPNVPISSPSRQSWYSGERYVTEIREPPPEARVELPADSRRRSLREHIDEGFDESLDDNDSRYTNDYYDRQQYREQQRNLHSAEYHAEREAHYQAVKQDLEARVHECEARLDEVTRENERLRDNDHQRRGRRRHATFTQRVQGEAYQEECQRRGRELEAEADRLHDEVAELRRRLDAARADAATGASTTGPSAYTYTSQPARRRQSSGSRDRAANAATATQPSRHRRPSSATREAANTTTSQESRPRRQSATREANPAPRIPGLSRIIPQSRRAASADAPSRSVQPSSPRGTHTQVYRRTSSRHSRSNSEARRG